MKRIFKGQNVNPKSAEWQAMTKDLIWLSHKVINYSESPTHKIDVVIGKEYFACEYKLKLNLFAFGKLCLYIPFTVIAPPISVDTSGYGGDLKALITDYKNRRGLFLMLNLDDMDINVFNDIDRDFAMGKTLSSCVLENGFSSFSEYLSSLRSHYRRRINLALKKAESLQVKRIESVDFDEGLYALYLQVLAKSKFPLETLPIDFFRGSGSHIDVFYKDSLPLAFVMTRLEGDSFNFIFGGMDYKFRDKYDLYYNMLVHIIKNGIALNATKINLGQTTEDTKCRLGCALKNKYMIAFSGNRFINKLLIYFAPLLENHTQIAKFKTFKK